MYLGKLSFRMKVPTLTDYLLMLSIYLINGDWEGELLLSCIFLPKPSIGLAKLWLISGLYFLALMTSTDTAPPAFILYWNPNLLSLRIRFSMLIFLLICDSFCWLPIGPFCLSDSKERLDSFWLSLLSI